MLPASSRAPRGPRGERVGKLLAERPHPRYVWLSMFTTAEGWGSLGAMHLQAQTVDDLLGRSFRRLAKSGAWTRSSKGRARELVGVLLELKNPRARFSRTETRGALISHLGETLWYLSGSDELSFIEYYIPKYRQFIDASPSQTVAPGAYGPRLFADETSGQLMDLIEFLRKKSGVSDTRQAVLQIFRERDLASSGGDVPCTTTIQFLPRQGKLHAIVTMRSNDAYRGLPGDVFAFTFIQELVARSLHMDVGIYRHFVGSLHLYQEDLPQAKHYLGEGFQSQNIYMPEMPDGDPWESVRWLLRVERAIRCGDPEPSEFGIDGYWLDLRRLLLAKFLSDTQNLRDLALVRSQMSSTAYDAYIRGRQQSLHRTLSKQLELPGI